MSETGNDTQVPITTSNGSNGHSITDNQRHSTDEGYLTHSTAGTHHQRGSTADASNLRFYFFAALYFDFTFALLNYFIYQAITKFDNILIPLDMLLLALIRFILLFAFLKGLTFGTITLISQLLGSTS